MITQRDARAIALMALAVLAAALLAHWATGGSVPTPANCPLACWCVDDAGVECFCFDAPTPIEYAALSAALPVGYWQCE